MVTELVHVLSGCCSSDVSQMTPQSNVSNSSSSPPALNAWANRLNQSPQQRAMAASVGRSVWSGVKMATRWVSGTGGQGYSLRSPWQILSKCFWQLDMHPHTPTQEEPWARQPTPNCSKLVALPRGRSEPCKWMPVHQFSGWMQPASWTYFSRLQSYQGWAGSLCVNESPYHEGKIDRRSQ